MITLPPLALLLSILLFAAIASLGYSLAAWVMAPKRLRIRHDFSVTPVELGLILTLVAFVAIFALPLFVPGILASH